jgi:hypothetical protein
MKIVLCPNCKTRVVPTREGECPSCRRAAFPAMPPPDETQPCPSCSSPLASQAVLCVACGFHIAQGVHLAMVAERARGRASDSLSFESREPIPIGSPAPPPGEIQACPSCGSFLASHAVLCVGCGFHLAKGVHLATVAEEAGRRASSSPSVPTCDSNPYASPMEADNGLMPLESELTPEAVKTAEAIVAEARQTAIVVALCLFTCNLAPLFVLPWYAWRLRQWHALNNRFQELREPNSFSPHAELAVNFQDAREKIRNIIVFALTFAAIGAVLTGFQFWRLLWAK